jgi:hypothetical protein
MTFETFGRVRLLLQVYRSSDREAPGQWTDALGTTLPVELNWMMRGACRNVDNVSWFPNPGDPAEAAQAVCRSCIVRRICLEHAIERREVGIWGGTDERERAAIRDARRNSS